MNKTTGILALAFVIGLAACKVYSFKDTSIPPEVKTIHLAYIENRARLVNPALAPALNDALRQKINNQASRLSQIPTSDADYDVTAWVSDYSIGTSGISAQQASSNRLTVTVHVVFKNNLDPTGKKVPPANFETDVTRNFDFAASQSISDFEAQQLPTITSNLTDEIFNKLFSNW
jgi:Lipopolysaccharide-assembly